MRSQVLTQKDSSQIENSKYSILVNEMQRRFDVMNSRIDIQEQVDTIYHFTQQLCYSGYPKTQIRDIVESGLKGVVREEKRRQDNVTRYRSGC